VRLSGILVQKAASSFQLINREGLLMGKIFILLFILLTMFSCSQYYKFDELYDKGEYLKAFHLLDNIIDKSNIHYQMRLSGLLSGFLLTAIVIL
jgi:hypothetical protein